MSSGQDRWFSSAEQAGMADFWRVYDEHFDHLNDAILQVARVDAEFGPVIAAIDPALLAEEQKASRERMGRAVLGEWSDYDAHLQQQGINYARLGVSYSAWHRIARSVERELVPRLVAAFSAEPDRLTRAMLAQQAFFGRAMARIGEFYLAAKQASVHESEEDLSITLDSIGDGVIATDRNGAIVKMNPVAEQLTGWKLADAKGRPLKEVFRLINEETREPVENPADRVLREGMIVGLANHTLLLGRDGVERPIADSGAPIRDGDGAMRGVVMVFRDQSEQRAAEAALRRSEARFRRLADSGAIGVVQADTVGGFIDANQPFLDMVGYTREDLLAGRVRWADMTPPEYRHLDETALRELAEVGVFQTFEKEYLRKDGSRVPILLGGALLEDGSVIAFILDISSRRRVEELKSRSRQLELDNRRIEEANRLKSEFLANMSHELRTPLNAIIGFSELLHDGAVRSDMPQYKEFLGDILNSGRHLLQLINDVLDLSKVESGKFEFHPEPTELDAVFKEVTAILRTVAAEKQLCVACEVDPSLGVVVIDVSRLKQVLYNYISNALKFTPPGGQVTVRARAEGEAAFRIEVEDNGIGIAAEDIKLLFTEFQQLDAGIAKQHAGTGLGLALTRRLVEAQGGAVGVRSEPGKGSVFHAILPRQAKHGRPMPLPRVIAGARSGAPSVLVIEDSEQDQGTIVGFLTSAGYAVETASTGAQAIEICRTRVFDAITLDLLLPDIGGLDVLRAIRNSSENQEVPVIVITVVTERGAVAGFAVHDILGKPLDSATLLASLERAGATPDRTGTVLIVEDDAGSARLMQASLDQLGYEAVWFDRGSEALLKSEESPPLAVILDMVMPEMSGLAFLERFRKIPTCRRVPVVVWTVKDLTEEEYERLQASSQGFLKKGREVGSAMLDELKHYLPAARGAAGGEE